MQFTNILAVAALLAGSAFAAPAADANKPAKPEKPTTTKVTQINNCGNGGAPYCCDTDSFGAFTTCSLTLAGSVCSDSSTTICCDANNSIQLCLGRATIV